MEPEESEVVGCIVFFAVRIVDVYFFPKLIMIIVGTQLLLSHATFDPVFSPATVFLKSNGGQNDDR
jgi:hypothetical protein